MASSEEPVFPAPIFWAYPESGRPPWRSGRRGEIYRPVVSDKNNPPIDPEPGLHVTTEDYFMKLTKRLGVVDFEDRNHPNTVALRHLLSEGTRCFLEGVDMNNNPFPSLAESFISSGTIGSATAAAQAATVSLLYVYVRGC